MKITFAILLLFITTPLFAQVPVMNVETGAKAQAHPYNPALTGSNWTVSGSNIWRNSRVGIGTSTFQQSLTTNAIALPVGGSYNPNLTDQLIYMGPVGVIPSSGISVLGTLNGYNSRYDLPFGAMIYRSRLISGNGHFFLTGNDSASMSIKMSITTAGVRLNQLNGSGTGVTGIDASGAITRREFEPTNPTLELFNDGTDRIRAVPANINYWTRTGNNLSYLPGDVSIGSQSTNIRQFKLSGQMAIAFNNTAPPATDGVSNMYFGVYNAHPSNTPYWFHQYFSTGDLGDGIGTAAMYYNVTANSGNALFANQVFRTAGSNKLWISGSDVRFPYLTSGTRRLAVLGTNNEMVAGSQISATAPTNGQVLQWNGTEYTPTTLGSSWLRDGNSFGATATIGTNDPQSFGIETSSVTRTTYSSTGTVTHTLPANQSHVFDQSGSAAVSNSPVVAKGPVNATQSTIFYSGQDASGNPQYAVVADNTSVQMGATANKPLYFVSNGTYRGRIEAAAGQWVFGGSAASTAATNAAATFYTTNTASAPAVVLRPYEVGDVAEYARFETPGGTLRGKLEYNSGLFLTASGGATAAVQGATSSLLTNSGANKLTLASTGQVEYTNLTSDPSGLLPGHLWYNSTDARFKIREASATNVVATVEKDIAGTSTTVTSATHTPGASVLRVTYNATSNAITSTLGSTMLDGRTYIVRGTGNSTNSVTLSADTGFTLTVDGTSGTVSTYTFSTHEIVRVTRDGTTFIIDK